MAFANNQVLPSHPAAPNRRDRRPENPCGLERVTFLAVVLHVKPFRLGIFIGSNTATECAGNFDANKRHRPAPEDGEQNRLGAFGIPQN